LYLTQYRRAILENVDVMFNIPGYISFRILIESVVHFIPTLHMTVGMKKNKNGLDTSKNVVRITGAL
jgi:hypothetical protein